MRMENAHGLHPAWSPADWAQDTAQVGSFNLGSFRLGSFIFIAWENEM